MHTSLPRSLQTAELGSAGHLESCRLKQAKREARAGANDREIHPCPGQKVLYSQHKDLAALPQLWPWLSGQIAQTPASLPALCRGQRDPGEQAGVRRNGGARTHRTWLSWWNCSRAWRHQHCCLSLPHPAHRGLCRSR